MHFAHHIQVTFFYQGFRFQLYHTYISWNCSVFKLLLYSISILHVILYSYFATVWVTGSSLTNRFKLFICNCYCISILLYAFVNKKCLFLLIVSLLNALTYLLATVITAVSQVNLG